MGGSEIWGIGRKGNPEASSQLLLCIAFFLNNSFCICPQLVEENIRQLNNLLTSLQCQQYSTPVFSHDRPSASTSRTPLGRWWTCHRTGSPALEIGAVTCWPSLVHSIALVSTYFSSTSTHTGWRYQDAGDNEAGSWIPAEFLCRQPAESSLATQAYKPVSQPRGKTSGLSGTLWGEDMKQ